MVNNQAQKNIPKEWREIKLGEIGDISMCKRILKNQTSTNGDIPFFKIGTFGKEPDAFISEKLYNEYKQKYPFPKKGDILISASGTIGRTVIYNGEHAYFQDSNIVWIDNNEKQVLNKYLYYFYTIVKWSVASGAIARLYNDNIRKIKVLAPPILEQKRIVKVLETWDKAIELLDKKIEIKKNIKKGLMQRLLTGKIRLKGYSEEWKKVKLGDICNKNKKTRRTSSEGLPTGRYPFFINNSESFIKYLNDYDFNGKYLIANTGGIAHFNYYSGKFSCMNDCLVLDCEIDTKYIFYWLKLMERYINSIGFVGSGLKHLDRNWFFKLKLFIPSDSKEQKEISSILTSADQEIEKLEEKRRILQEQKKYLLNNLVTGAIRTPEDI